jgi:hypothetical protein
VCVMRRGGVGDTGGCGCGGGGGVTPPRSRTMPSMQHM